MASLTVAQCREGSPHRRRLPAACSGHLTGSSTLGGRRQTAESPGLSGACDHVDEASVLELDAGVSAHVPQLWDLDVRLWRGTLNDLVRQSVPRGVDASL